MINIRKATPEDFDALAEIWEAAVRATHDFLTDDDISNLRPQVRELYIPQIPMQLAENESGQPLGFIGCHENRIEMLFVAPQSRGTGVGKLLLQYAIEHLQVDEVDVNEQNPQGIGFYRHMGFVQTGRSDLDGEGNPFPLLHLKLAR
ncbi:acetyltransferase [Cedecea davisae]|uniref:acetyltransferase n=1 Tax=Cedecea davisae TaxID=158484 RepID=UPI0024302515|nr:acetyltransferase [Cedecea davisae]